MSFRVPHRKPSCPIRHVMHMPLKSPFFFFSKWQIFLCSYLHEMRNWLPHEVGFLFNNFYMYKTKCSFLLVPKKIMLWGFVVKFLSQIEAPITNFVQSNFNFDMFITEIKLYEPYIIYHKNILDLNKSHPNTGQDIYLELSIYHMNIHYILKIIDWVHHLLLILVLSFFLFFLIFLGN